MVEEKQLLKDANIYPSEEVLAQALNDIFDTFVLFKEMLDKLALKIEWRYYNDGKCWLGKIVEKGKTIFWLSIWTGFFKTTFYFTEKTKAGIFDLSISNKIKEDFKNARTVGKLIPLILNIEKDNQLADIKAIMEYKRKIK